MTIGADEDARMGTRTTMPTTTTTPLTPLVEEEVQRQVGEARRLTTTATTRLRTRPLPWVRIIGAQVDLLLLGPRT
jgi:hypothetical protein